MKKKNFYPEFLSWILGLIEDNPIPFEIESLVFYINKNNEIGFSGTERKNVTLTDRFFYNPLEAQYFFCPQIYKIMFECDGQKKLGILKNLLEALKKDKNFKKFNIFYGFLYQNAYKI